MKHEIETKIIGGDLLPVMAFRSRHTIAEIKAEMARPDGMIDVHKDGDLFVIERGEARKLEHR